MLEPRSPRRSDGRLLDAPRALRPECQLRAFRPCQHGLLIDAVELGREQDLTSVQCALAHSTCASQRVECNSGHTERVCPCRSYASNASPYTVAAQSSQRHPSDAVARKAGAVWTHLKRVRGVSLHSLILMECPCFVQICPRNLLRRYCPHDDARDDQGGLVQLKEVECMSLVGAREQGVGPPLALRVVRLAIHEIAGGAVQVHDPLTRHRGQPDEEALVLQ